MGAVTYPVTPAVDHVDEYHGVRVADPYRWLEDESSAARGAWIVAQNELTEAYLSALPIRGSLRRRFEQLLQYRRYYQLCRRGPYLFFRSSGALDPQPRAYVQSGLDGAADLLIDPSTLSSDGSVRLTTVVPSSDGTWVVYGISQGGSDWEEYLVRHVPSRTDLPDRLRWIKASNPAWSGRGFFYSRYPAPRSMAHATSERNENHQVWYHRLGTPQEHDVLVHEDPTHPLRVHMLHPGADERFIALAVHDSEPGHVGNALWILRQGDEGHGFTPVVTSFDDTFRLVDAGDDGLIVLTTRNAPNGRVILISPHDTREGSWKELIPETNSRLDVVIPVGGRLFATYRCDAVHRLCVFDRAGRFDHDISLPGTGLAQVFPGQHADQEALWTLYTFTAPATIYRYDMASKTSSIMWRARPTLGRGEYETHRLVASASDGTPIPIFIVHRKGVKLPGRHPLLLYGYGADGTSIGPAFDPLLVALLERGVMYAVACVRGGGEFGEAWHRAGRQENKQTSVSDFIAVAEWLQCKGYTCPELTAITGSSNGGLLVSAAMVQRPDLFRVALPDVPLCDMLRFQLFTVGGLWTAEYGSSADPAMLPVLLAYSPLHNVRDGVAYPATLVTTSEHDDRVVPAHAFKFIATLQRKGAAGTPFLIRIDRNSGHGPMSLPKMLAERADIYAFLLENLKHSEPPGA